MMNGDHKSFPRATISSWAIIGTTARTAATGGWCRRSTSSARSSSAGGRSPRRECSKGWMLGPVEARYSPVSRVLLHVLFLNLGVAIAKIAFGYSSGAISILSDGFHSLTDAASNVVGLIGIKAAARPPHEDHPYGHRKYETVAAAAVILFLLVVVVEVLRNAFNHLTGRVAPVEIS